MRITNQRLTAAAAIIVFAIWPATRAEGQQPAEDAEADYADVNGLHMYYEIHGSARRDRPPLVLLHGAFGSIETDLAGLLSSLAEERRVIAVELQGHGRTGDIDRPLSYRALASDVAALLANLGIQQTDIYGYSLGGGVALQLALDHPALVRKWIFAGGTGFGPDGLHEGILEAEEAMTPEDLDGTPWKEAYLRLSPDPDFPTLVEKMKTLDLAWKGWTPAQLRSIDAPALLIIGDADIMRPEHTVEMFELLGGSRPGDLEGLPQSQLAVLPGTTHVGVLQRIEWLVTMVTAFLDAPDAAG